jgi:putative methionine-R-sulfoxide reductase with GAF domain
MTPAQRELLQELQSFAVTAPTAHSLNGADREKAAREKTRYNWVGFYLVDRADPSYFVSGV